MRLSICLLSLPLALSVMTLSGCSAIVSLDDYPPDGNCGDGDINAGEQCDTSNLSGQSCASLQLGGGDLACTDECQFDTSQCDNGPDCGNAEVDPGEVCDGNNLDGQSCQSLGEGDGVLRCQPNCSAFDVSDCQTGPSCGNDVLEPPEVCDGNDFGPQTCADFGFAAGMLSCNADCTVIDTQSCFGTCGDMIIEGTEVCDTYNLAGATCGSEGLLGGVLRCGPDCHSYDTTDCFQTCGDGTIQQREHCDQSNLQGQDCTSLGFNVGGAALSCLPNCSFDTSQCGPPPQCAATGGELNCNASITDDSMTSGLATNINNFYFGTDCLGWQMTGPEIIYHYNPGNTPQPIHVNLSGLASDLDLVVLASPMSGQCSPASHCVGWSDQFNLDEENVFFVAQPNTDYYFVVDAPGNNGGTFSLVMNCL